ncbi:hypothetical protein B0H13DRAFT_2391442 [Mycena leptocephala]|nr:hypothetical protein B0H13DRAFT_2391442 [Mycena leptocephala]
MSTWSLASLDYKERLLRAACFIALDATPPPDAFQRKSWSSCGSTAHATWRSSFTGPPAAPVAETPEATVGLIRDAVSVLLKNMVALGKASVTYGKHAEGEEPAFFVPSEGTTLFGMAERFVDLYGFHEDSSLLDRAILFENLCTLQEAMIRNPGYLELGIDFPNFDLSSTELEWYGIFPFYKARQIALLSATHFRRRKFGGELLRYNPELGKKEGIRSPIFRWRDCPHVLTHPNRWRNPKKLDRTQHPFRSWGCYGTDFDERMDWSRCWGVILRLERKILAYFALGGPSYA